MKVASASLFIVGKNYSPNNCKGSSIARTMLFSVFGGGCPRLEGGGGNKERRR